MSIALKNIYQVTRQQYNKLLNGETIAGHQYDDQALYLVEGEEAPSADLSNYYTITQADNKIDEKISAALSAIPVAEGGAY